MCAGEWGELRDGVRLEYPFDAAVPGWAQSRILEVDIVSSELSEGMGLFHFHATQ